MTSAAADRVARLSGLRLRRRGGRQLGGALLARAQPQSRHRLARGAVRVRRRGDAAGIPAGRVHLRGLRDVRPAQRRAFRGRAARPVDVRAGSRRGLACAVRARGLGARSVPARRRCRRRAAPGHRRREDDAGHPPLPAAVAPAPGARRDPRFPCRAAARPREGRVGGAEERGDRGAAQVRGRGTRRRDGRGSRGRDRLPPRRQRKRRRPARRSLRPTTRGSRRHAAPAATSAS